MIAMSLSTSNPVRPFVRTVQLEALIDAVRGVESSSSYRFGRRDAHRVAAQYRRNYRTR